MNAEKNKPLLDALNHCAIVCYSCASACLEEKMVQQMTKCIKLDMDCAGICQLTAGYIARGSEHRLHLVEECLEICEACAAECEKHAHMEHCRDCAEACRQCADACKKMLPDL